jgi:tape measure domain-containing protein
MATAELVVAFGAKLDGLEASLKRVTTKLGELESSAKKSSEGIGKALEGGGGFDRFSAGVVSATRSLVAFYAAIKGLTALRDGVVAVDDLNQSITRLRVLTSSSQSMSLNIFGNLAQIARQTGQPLQDVTDQFTRFYNATANLGASTSEVQRFVQVLAQFAQIGGAKPQEAAAAITQLAQGLASGKLQGDELKSILENMPVLAQALASALNVSVGTLRQMGEEGKLTAANVFPAILRAGEQMGDRLRGIPLSLRQSWQVLSDTATSVIAELDRRIGGTEWLSRLLVNMANIVRYLGLTSADTRGPGANPQTNMEVFALRRIQGEERLAQINQQIAEKQREYDRLMQTGPQGRALARDIPAAIRGLEQQRDAVAAATLEAAVDLEAQRDRIAREERENAERREREGRENRIRDGNRRARDIAENANPELKARRERADRIEALEKELVDRRIAARQRGGDAMLNVEAFERQQRADIEKIFQEDMERITAGARAEARQAEAERRRQERERLERARAEQRQIQDIRRAGDDGMAGFRQQMADWDMPGENGIGSPFALFIAQAANDANQITILLRAITSEGEKAAQALLRVGEDPQLALNATQSQLEIMRNRLVEAGANAEEVGRLIEIAMGRTNTAVQQMGDKAGRTFNDIKVAAVNNFTQSAADAIVEFATTGEAKFDEMAANFLKNIAKMILQLMLFRAIATGLGAAGISIPGVTPGVQGRMAGGPVSAGTPYVVGEKRPELFVPGSSGYIFPEVGGGGMTVNVYNSAGANVRTNETTDSQGGRVLEIYVENIVRQGLSSGRFDGAMRQNYNLTRPGRV